VAEKEKGLFRIGTCTTHQGLDQRKWQKSSLEKKGPQKLFAVFRFGLIRIKAKLLLAKI